MLARAVGQQAFHCQRHRANSKPVINQFRRRASMGDLTRILQIFLFHLTRRIVNRMPFWVVIVLAVLIIALLLSMPFLTKFLGAEGWIK